MKSVLPAAVAAACITLFGQACGPKQPPTSDQRSADEAAVRHTDLEWSKTAETRNVDALMPFYTEDAILLAPDAPIAVGKEAIRGALSTVYGTPGFSAKWEPVTVDVALSGEIAYIRGVVEATMSGPSGSLVQRGKYVEIWKKQADGSWKCAVDILNFDAPPAPRRTITD